MGNLSSTSNPFAGNLIKLLPTGTMFVYQFLSPVLTNNGGHCNPLRKSLTISLIGLCGISCFISSFTDSYKADHGSVHYGFLSRKGLWPNPHGKDLSHLKLRVRDVVHAYLSLAVLAVIALLDPNTQKCLYPSLLAPSKERVLNMVLPPVIGTLAGIFFTLFPSKRHGIGYP